MSEPPAQPISAPAPARSEPLWLVHLVRAANPIEPLRRFLDSYRLQPAGVEHRLVLLFKGFRDPAAADAHRDLAGELSFEEIHVSDEGFDLSAYRQAADTLAGGRYCFLNSNSRILAPGWLGHLDRALSLPGTGLVGASGSWASMLSYALFHVGLPSAYGRVYPDRAATLAAFQQLERQRTGSTASVSAPRRWLATALALAASLKGFERFPSQHVRTNAFVIDHDTLMRTTNPALRSKADSHRLESGRDGLTRQVQRLGLGTVVVDRRGRAHAPPDWPASETFWQGAQRGLLVGDNQTADYDSADAARRLLLARYAWGERAAPL
jgi:hypothetical protein